MYYYAKMNTFNHIPPFNRAAQMETLGDKIAAFQHAFGLSAGATQDFTVKHDAAHAMTGLTTCLADELRIDLYLSALANHVLQQQGPHWIALRINARDNMEKLLWRLRSHHQDPANFKLVMTSRDDHKQTELDRLQLHSTPLHPDEIDAHLRLGVEITARLYDLIGTRYIQADCAVISQLAFSSVDFIEQASAIKAAYQTPENAEVERASLALMTAKKVIGMKGKTP